MANQNSKPISVTKFSSKSASSFWYDFDTNFKNGSELDLTKLAAAQRAIGNFVTIVTGKQIPVVFQSNDSSYTDGDRVVIGTKLEDKHFDPAVGLALHEGSHIALTDFSLFKTSYGYATSTLQDTKMADIAREHGCGDLLTTSELNNIKGLLNWIEDRRIDYHVYTNAPGYRVYYEAMYNRYFNDKIIDKALTTKQKNKETWDDYMFHIINFTNPNRQLKTLKQLETIWTLIDLKHINRLHSTNDALLLSCELFKIIKLAVATANNREEKPKSKPKSDETKQMQPSDKDDNNNEFVLSDPADDMESDSNESPQPQNTSDGDESDDTEETNVNDDEEFDVEEELEAVEDEEDEEDEEEEDEPEPMSQRDADKLNNAIEKQRTFILGKTPKNGRLSKTQNAMVRALKESGTESRTVYTGPGKSDPIDAIVIKKLTAPIICSLPELFVRDSASFINGYQNYKTGGWSNAKRIRENEAAVTQGVILGKQLGSKLQVRNSDKTLKTTRLQSGKIDRRLVAQLGYNNVDVFHKIVTDRFKNYFIHISIDASGSMSGTKFQNAITSAVAIAQAASMTTGIRVQISLRGTAQFSNLKEKCITLYAYDSAHDKMSKIRNLFKYLEIFGCTPEGLAFKSIESDIRIDAKGDECIFINYSDGEPTSINGCAHGYNGVQFTKSVITSYRQLGIDIISYFIHVGGASHSTAYKFRTMYGPDAQFINPMNMTDVSKTVNRKFLEKAI
jgi:hypothetical protein